MTIKTTFAFLLAASLVPLAGANAACQVENKASIALQTPFSSGGPFTVPVEVNGVTATFILDTGAERSVLTEDAVRRLGVARDQWVGTTMSGVGGIQSRPNADPQSLRLGGVPLMRRTLNHDTSLTVATLPRTRFGGMMVDGLLGRDFLSLFDLDLDVPHRRLTLFQVRDCAGRFLPWTDDYQAIPATVPAHEALVVPVMLNETPLRALLDTGATSSLLGAPGVHRLDLEPAAFRNDPADQVGGLGPRTVTMYRHTFGSLRVGGETIDHPVIWVAPVQLRPIVDMLLGADWVSGQRIWISFSTQQLFVAAR